MARITNGRTLIAPGVYRYRSFLVAEARFGSARSALGRARERFPLGTPLLKIQAWQHGARRDLMLAAPSAPARGSLAADIPTFTESLPAGLYREDSVDLLAHWAASPLGAMPRHSVTRLDVISQISRWTDAGAAVSSCNRRLSRLRKLYQTLDGVTAPNPTDKITFTREPEGEPRDIPIRIVRLILDSLQDRGRAERGGTRPGFSQTKIRLRVMAWTGIAGATLRRVRPRDLELKNARIYLRPRRKGKGTDGAWVALLPPAVDALRDFAAAQLFGQPWSRSAMRKTWHVGIKRAKLAAAVIAKETGDDAMVQELAHLPPRCKPYDLRHSFASEIYRLTGDIRAVSELLQHADMETTKRYTKGAVSDRVTAAIAKARTTFEAMDAAIAEASAKLANLKTGTHDSAPAPLPGAPKTKRLRLVQRAAK